VQRRGLQRAHVLGKTGAAVPAAGVDEVITDAGIGADSLAHLLDVGAQDLGDVGDLVDEADLGGKHGIGGVLGEFRRAHVHHHDPLPVAVEGRIQSAQQLLGPGRASTDHDPIRLHEIVDRRSLLEELRVRGHFEFHTRAPFGEHPGDAFMDLLGGADRHRGLGNHQRTLLQLTADHGRRAEHVADVRGTVLPGRGAHGDEDHLRLAEGGLGITLELQHPGALGLCDAILEAGLEHWADALAQPCDALRIDVEADDLVAGVGQAGGGHQPDVAAAHHSDLHGALPRDFRAEFHAFL